MFFYCDEKMPLLILNGIFVMFMSTRINDYSKVDVAMEHTSRIRTWLEIFLTALKLGLTSFGGPVAHLGYFHQEYVQRKKWIDEKTYGDLVALCQFLPGPASSQVGIGIGVLRGGAIGGIMSFLGFTLPSASLLILFAAFMQTLGMEQINWFNGLKLVALAVVAHAVIQMAKSFAFDMKTKLIALFTLVFLLLWQAPFAQISAIAVSGIIGLVLFQNGRSGEHPTTRFPLSKRFGALSLTLFFGFLLFLPFVHRFSGHHWAVLLDGFYRSGALVFGGGHVVLPLLENEFVPTWLNEQQFLTGYGMAQAVPGPLFTFASYLGTVIAGWQGGLIATFAIFLPAVLLIFGALPFWDMLRKNRFAKSALIGINASVVGILAAALYDPIWTSSVHSTKDVALAAILFAMLVHFKLPPWTVVLAGLFGWLLFNI